MAYGPEFLAFLAANGKTAAEYNNPELTSHAECDRLMVEFHNPSGAPGVLDFRDDLLQRVDRGELSRADANAIAKKRHGLHSIDWPDPARFDPMSAAEWSLPMTLAWVIYRDPTKMRDPESLLRLYEPYRCAARDWVIERTKTAFDRRPGRPPRLSAADVLADAVLSAPDEAGRDAVHAARDDLGCALKPPGRLVAYGWPYPKPLPSGKSGIPEAEPIPAAAWSALTTFYDLEISIGAGDVGRAADTRYTDLLLYREQVLAIWPAANAVAPVDDPPSAAPEMPAARCPPAPRPVIPEGKTANSQQVRRINLAEIYDALTFDALDGHSAKKRISLVRLRAQQSDKLIPSPSIERDVFAEWKRLIAQQAR